MTSPSAFLAATFSASFCAPVELDHGFLDQFRVLEQVVLHHLADGGLLGVGERVLRSGRSGATPIRSGSATKRAAAGRVRKAKRVMSDSIGHGATRVGPSRAPGQINSA